MGHLYDLYGFGCLFLEELLRFDAHSNMVTARFWTAVLEALNKSCHFDNFADSMMIKRYSIRTTVRHVKAYYII